MLYYAIHAVRERGGLEGIDDAEVIDAVHAAARR
jgi:hypothetical protein